MRAHNHLLAPIATHGPTPCPGLQLRRDTDVVGLCECERSDGSRGLGESCLPAVARPEGGGAAADAPQPQAADAPPEAPEGRRYIKDDVSRDVS